MGRAATTSSRSTSGPGSAFLRSDVHARYRNFSFWIAATDGLSMVAAMVVAFLIRFGLRAIPPDFLALIALAPMVLIGFFAASRLYSVQLLGPAEEFRRVITTIGTIVATIALFGFWSHISYSRLWLGLTWILATILCLVTRKRWRSTMARKRADGSLAYRTLIVGANHDAINMLEAFRSPRLGFTPVGIVTPGLAGAPSGEKLDAGLTRIPGEALGHVEDLRRAIRALGVECVVVGSTAVTADDIARIAKASRLEGIDARLALNVPQILPTRLTVQPVDQLTIISLRSAHLSGTQALAKRAVDVVGALIGLLVVALPSIAIAIAIKARSDGPVLFRQVRLGKQGRRFTLLKFRTMVPEAEGMLIDLRERNEADGPLFKIRDDPRITSVGRWLRRWSLDELPQFVNVLRGDMSLVGPRPPLPHEVALYEEWQLGRLEVAPGITGLWQIEGRIELPFDEAVRRDIFYIENWSLSYDLFILAKTLPAILSRRGAC